MSARLAKQAGGALTWKAIQLAGIKGIFVVRILILARLLSPEDFGLLAIATVTIGVLMSLTDFGMMPALVQRPDPAEQDYHAAWIVGVIRALAVTGVVVLTAPVVAGLFGEPQAAAIIRMLALRPLLEASASIKVADLTRNLRFRSLAFISLPEALVNTLVSIALARALGVWALVVGTLAGSAVYVAMSYLLAPYRPRLALDMVAARPLIRYGRWIFVTSLVAMAGSSVLQAVISLRLGAAELGLYFLAAKLAFLPYEVASEVVGAVTFPLYARLRADVLQTALAFRAIVRGMAVLLIPVHTLIIALAPSLVRNVLGPRWAGAEPVIQVLALAGLVGLV
ncbi:MAG: oligosaccharide flippase family protein, partial [Anaerolineales bacterium]